LASLGHQDLSGSKLSFSFFEVASGERHRTMIRSRDHEISAIDLSRSEYTVEQTGRDKDFRPEY
jgi:hypothetical protein